MARASQTEENAEFEVEEEPKSDSSTSSVSSSPPAKPRRKSQAFGVPKTAKLRAIINQNAAESPLLRLPREIRARIWKYLIGDRLLHIEKPATCEGHQNSMSACCCVEKPWFTFRCIASYSEQQLFARSKIPLKELISKDEAENGTLWDQSCPRFLEAIDSAERREWHRDHLQRHPHFNCQQFIANVHSGQCNLLRGDQLRKYRRKDHILPVQILRVCRQVYIEANPLLWSSNTLSFREPSDFSKFMRERITSQKASITSLLLDLSGSKYWFYKLGGSQRATTNGVIKVLTGLRTLHLYLDDQLDDSYSYHGIQRVGLFREAMKTYEKQVGFTNYKQLPLSTVTVLIVKREYGIHLIHDGDKEDRYQEERVKYAEYVRQTILDTEGAEKFRQEQADADAAREKELEEARKIEPPCMQASTTEDCARINQAAQTRPQASNKSKPIKPKTQARACKAEHVCLVCFKELQRGREKARNCINPGQCDKGYFKVMFKRDYAFVNIDSKVLVHAEDTIKVVMARYIGIVDIGKNLPCVLRFNGVDLNPDSTVQQAGIGRLDTVEVSVEDRDSSADDLFRYA